MSVGMTEYPSIYYIRVENVRTSLGRAKLLMDK